MTEFRSGVVPKFEERHFNPFVIRQLNAFVLRAPIATPIQTSFGTMTDRPAVFVRVIDEDGVEGWGEIWCNFPSVGAEHRAALVASIFQPLLTDHPFIHPADAFEMMTQSTAVLALQSGEVGPFAQVIAGIDLAMWDLWARKANLPLWRLLGGQSDEIGVYASGLNPIGAEQLIHEKAQQGYNAFKLKVGFGCEQDLASIASVREIIGPDCKLMVDANQAWDLQTAMGMTSALGSHGLGWIEEPMRCDRPLGEWQTLTEHSPVPVAAGENLSGADSFRAIIESRALSVVQPDAAKWGGISGCWPVIKAIKDAGLRYCPHYLGGGIGLMASAHLLAAAGGDGLLEIDANPNPLRTLLSGPIASPHKGRVTLGDAPGIGITPSIGELAERLKEAA